MLKIMNKKIITLSVATLLSFSGMASAEYLMKFNNSQSKGMIPEASAQSKNSSCKDILESGNSTGNGVYSITVNNKEFDVYCDMTSAGGGWTMVVAQFEQDPVTNWNEGIQADYDPTLSTGKSFALSSQEIPSHTQTAFGKNLDADNLNYANFNYSTGNIPKTLVLGLKDSLNYHIYRNDGNNYLSQDPEQSLYFLPDWFDTLTFDREGGRYYTWAFSPKNSVVKNRGFSYTGLLTSSFEYYAWTVWVR